jgi:uncharacterized protein (DUF1501 family)
LVEAGTRFVEVVWPKVANSDNHSWDVHADLSKRMKTQSAPMLDTGVSALIEDLDQRGLLKDTLVVVVGEFGRTPRINKQGGRDHWGHVFSMALAGAGVRGGQVIGASDKNGAYPSTDPIRGGDPTATIFHLLGIDAHTTVPDQQGRPVPIAGDGIVRPELLG